MASHSEISKHIVDLIASNPGLAPELTELLDKFRSLEIPEIAVEIDGGVIRNVERFNEAPFRIFIHNHDIEGADQISELTRNDGKMEPAIISRYDFTNVHQKWDGPYWYSLRNPVAFRMELDEAA